MLLRKRFFLLCFVLISVAFLFTYTMHPRLDQMNTILDATILRKKPQPASPITTHIVLFKFKENTSPIQIKDITSKMLALKKSCIHPSTRSTYIKSITGGKDNSIEKLQEGMTHAFIVQFHSNEDRNYYVDNDPVHKIFKEAAAPYLDKAMVVDFQEGVFHTSP